MTNNERDRILLNGTLDEWRSMFIEVSGCQPSCDEVVERAGHKAITAISYFPEDRRESSRRWLLEHASEPWG
jgi:hypothetical protein